MKSLLRKVHLRLMALASQMFYSILPPNIETLMSDVLETVLINPGAKKRILYIGLKYDYGDKNRGLSYEEYNFFFTLKNMRDIELLRFDFDSVANKYGKVIANNILKEVVLLENITTLFCLLYKDYYDYELIKLISDKYPVETIIWLFDDDKRDLETQELVKCFNKVVTTMQLRHQQRLEKGINSYLAQFSANHFIYRDYQLGKKYDVVFVGQKFGNREEYISHLKAAGVDVHAFGRGWDNGRLTQSSMIEVFNQSKIVLNFSSSYGHPHLKYLKGRVFEIPATGAFLLTEQCEELDDYFEVGVEVERFLDKEDLLRKVRLYLCDDELRERVASAGKLRVLATYTFERYFRDIFEINRES